MSSTETRGSKFSLFSPLLSLLSELFFSFQGQSERLTKRMICRLTTKQKKKSEIVLAEQRNDESLSMVGVSCDIDVEVFLTRLLIHR
jgi:hypothetical protein